MKPPCKNNHRPAAIPVRALHCVIAMALTLTATGCGHYVAPMRGADMSLFGGRASADVRRQQTDPGINRMLDRQPLAQFPASLAVVRVQAPGYRSYRCESYGRGRYSVVTTRDIETDEHFQRLQTLPQIDGVSPVNRLLVSHDLQSDDELRRAAAALHADLLLVYTIDTTFRSDDKAVPLTVFTLGLFPGKVARVVTTASAVLLDTRNGYVYSVVEGTDKTTQLANAWTNEQAVEDSRRRTELKAFDSMLDQFEKAWPHVVARYAHRIPQPRPHRAQPRMSQPVLPGYRPHTPPGPRYDTP